MLLGVHPETRHFVHFRLNLIKQFTDIKVFIVKADLAPMEKVPFMDGHYLDKR